MALNQRKDLIRSIGDGRLNVLTSCDVISEGTDIPAVAGAILLRPTQSLIVYLQQVGRVLRPKPDGSPAIILDHVNNVVRMGMPDADREWSLEGRSKRPAAPSVRQCPECYAAFAPAPKCPGCQFVFPIKARVVERKTADGDLREITQSDVEARLHYLRNEPLKALLKGAHTRDEIAEIAKARGYHHGWTNRMLAFKASGRARSFGGRAA
jgi:superfamily II DNA or RNA helicase